MKNYKKTGRMVSGALWPSSLERWTGDRTVLGSNPTAENFSLRSFGNSVYPAFPVSFGGDTKSRRSLLSGVYARGSERPHWNVYLSWTQPPTLNSPRSASMRRKTLPCTEKEEEEEEEKEEKEEEMTTFYQAIRQSYNRGCAHNW